jgi:hypothetical protein
VDRKLRKLIAEQGTCTCTYIWTCTCASHVDTFAHLRAHAHVQMKRHAWCAAYTTTVWLLATTPQAHTLFVCISYA